MTYLPLYLFRQTYFEKRYRKNVLNNIEIFFS